MRPSLPTIIAFTVLSASTAIAQTTTTGTPSTSGTSSGQSGGQNAVTRPNTDKPAGSPMATGAPGTVKLEPGANSFTEAQVRSRLEEAGFKDIADLKKDDQGIWRGKAMQSGKSVMVGYDFKGNVASQ